MKTKVFIIALVVLLFGSLFSAFAAGITVAPSSVGEQSVAVMAEDVKPSVCHSLYLTNIVSGSGTLSGTTANDLIIGSDGVDTIDGGGGDDCILSRGGDDIVGGGDGFDICLGGEGIDGFTSCESENQ